MVDQDGTARRRSRARQPAAERNPGTTREQRETAGGRGALPAPQAGDPDRGLRGLVGAGSTAVPVAAAMRARDASRPTEDDLAAAERELQVVRRHYVPPGAAPPGGRAGAQPGRGGSAPERS